jgi:hypothetical protein
MVLRPEGPARAVVLGSPEGVRWEVLLLGVRKAPKVSPAGTMTVVPVGALTASAVRRIACNHEATDAPFVFDSAEGPAWMAIEEIEQVIEAGMKRRGREGFAYALGWMHGGSMLLRTEPNEARMVQATVGALERALLRPVRVRILLVTGDRSPDLTAIVGMMDVPALVESATAAAAYRRIDFLRDYEVEVAQQSRIAAPVLGSAYAGVFANLHVNKTGDRSFRLRLGMRVSALPDGIETIHSGAREIGPLQRATERAVVQDAVFDLADGSSGVLDLGANPFAPGRPGRLFAVVSVTGE